MRLLWILRLHTAAFQALDLERTRSFCFSICRGYGDDLIQACWKRDGASAAPITGSSKDQDVCGMSFEQGASNALEALICIWKSK